MDTSVIIAISIVVILTLGMFYRPISRLIDRISGASKDGVVFDRPQESSIDSSHSSALSFVGIMRQPVSSSVLSREDATKKQLDSIEFSNEEEKITVLCRSLAVTNIELEFCNIENVIFGSQMELLYSLSSNHNGLEKSLAEIIFNKSKSDYPELHENKKFHNWLNYLLSNNLVTSNEETIYITQFGTDFIKYLIDSHKVYARHG